MKIITTRYLKGTNVWSAVYKPLVQIAILLEGVTIEKIERLQKTCSHLESFRSIPVVFQNNEIHDNCNLEEKYIILLSKIGLLLQPENNQLNYYFNFRATADANTYLFAFGYEDYQTARFVVDALKRIIYNLEREIDIELSGRIAEIEEVYFKNQLGPSTASIVKAAEDRGIPWRKFGDYAKIYLGYGANQMQFQATVAQTTSCIAVNDAGNKQKTKDFLSAMFIPVPAGTICDTEEELNSIINKLGYPLVIKPMRGNQGKGATINITSWTAAHTAFLFAKTISNTVLVERYTKGSDFRILLVDYKVVAAAKRSPAHVIGTGSHSVKELIEAENKNPERGVGHTKNLTKITIDQDTHNMMLKQNITLECVPTKDQTIVLKSTANLSTGGTAEDVTDTIHPENIKLAERAAKIMGLNICGLDLIAENLEQPIKDTKGVIIEVNAAPGFRMHLAPSFGMPRAVGKAVVDMLYPPKSEFRIPIISITGTNGKTTISRMTAFITKTAGFHTGFTTTDGIYINETIVGEGDMTGPGSAKVVLTDPTVNFAVLETARGGMIRSGLYYDHCDVGIISNIQGDHLGMHNVDTLEELADVKAIVAHSVKPDGWAVLNANDQRCVKIGSEVNCNVAYFVDNNDSVLIESLIKKNNPVAYFEDGNLTIVKDGESIIVAHTSQIPLTHNGTIGFMMANVLASALATYLQGISVEHIAKGLAEFVPTIENTPGRMNRYQHNGFEIIVDYAHNVFGYKAMKQYLEQFKNKRIFGIIAGVGDRRDQDIIECGLLAGQMFDYIIIRQEADLRGRDSENIVALLKQGISSSGKDITVEVIGDENLAIAKVLDLAKPGELVVALSEFFHTVNDIIQSHKIGIKQI